MSKQIGNYVRTKGLPKKNKSKIMDNNLDKIIKIHDYICEKMDKISQEDINKDSLQLGRFRAYSDTIRIIEDEYKDLIDKPSKKEIQ